LTALAWIVGSGGLLGAEVRRAAAGKAGLRCFDAPGGRLPWGDPPALRPAFAAAASEFLRAAREGDCEEASVFWCAGTGVVASPAFDLDADRQAWRTFLMELGAALDAPHPGRRLVVKVLLASSAGGVWGGATERPVTEATPPHPISAYGEAQLARERELAAFTAERPGTSAVIARLSNLYGPGQRLDKPQGLISHISRSVLLRRPVHLYVPLDTVRDYLFTEDAAHAILETLSQAPAGGVPRLRLLASEKATTIAEVLAVFHRLTRHRVAVVSGLHPVASLQPRILSFRSQERGAASRPPTPLLEGVARVYRHQLALLAQGRLVAPPVGI
jgi:UDP-glucose 4-epimerase